MTHNLKLKFVIWDGAKVLLTFVFNNGRACCAPGAADLVKYSNCNLSAVLTRIVECRSCICFSVSQYFHLEYILTGGGSVLTPA